MTRNNMNPSGIDPSRIEPSRFDHAQASQKDPLDELIDEKMADPVFRKNLIKHLNEQIEREIETLNQANDKLMGLRRILDRVEHHA